MSTFFTPNNVKHESIATLQSIIADNPGKNYQLVKDHLDAHMDIRRIVIKRYGDIADRSTWKDQYYDAIYALIAMVQGDGLSEDELD